ncbi:hypothetical protein GCM10010182_67010 [Actinomadura cremea]|nr:hypothetical protein GCM10010182_67010 [Actinomadura cremea]
MHALAVFTVAAASARPDTQAPLAGSDAPPPADPRAHPAVRRSDKNLVNALHPRHHGIDHTVHWQNWRDRHRARARWYHQRTAPPTHSNTHIRSLPNEMLLPH